jgi:hypothetical protein
VSLSYSATPVKLMECEKYAEKREEKYETSEEAEGTFFML